MEITIPLFSVIINKSVTVPIWETHPFTFDYLRKQTMIVPVRDSRSLSVAFPIPDLVPYYKSQVFYSKFTSKAQSFRMNLILTSLIAWLLYRTSDSPRRTRKFALRTQISRMVYFFNWIRSQGRQGIRLFSYQCRLDWRRNRTHRRYHYFNVSIHQFA